MLQYDTHICCMYSTSSGSLSKISCKILPRHDVSRFGKLARNLFQIHANFSNLQESFLSCKILVPNPCENLVLLDFWPDSCKILKRSCQDSFQDLGKIFVIGILQLLYKLTTYWELTTSGQRIKFQAS